ncbi:hypothetical protein PGT21_029300 [Puccinia graminis f. sp. tritici]|uniref:J domain-containing protein n=2 Tax=Puccinia graminis f. sp. tritici TaxID=56615 RepID=E3LBR7_PUCGT|nr:uncharacterized protein PGTG_20008 [Puccinia graminis f. sp. tritici CRL 75-36-700-3]EFP93992.2 hypothetical protein PGTG_20008 [Puccinia graminis f. sp. tritici CRL 75-36-700-3]KAA1075114.1 hypothetical protein PGT21_029300 [Puccinia graminis f. sp. tritici]KAA1126629.1 hypothetical protein PGTUg99_031365 [Puccinia graminis f. sp. tritici]
MIGRICLLWCFLGLALLASSCVRAWDAEDHEIFDLVSALEAAEGKGMTFYKFLNVPKSATLNEINKAARKLSLSIHPDKHPGNKTIEAKFSRLGLITAILRDEEKRKRYNFFHDNGVPRWKGTGYMYSRWQPGLGFAVSFVLLVATLMQYGAQHVNYRSEIARIQKFQFAARQAAYKKGEKSNAGSKSQGRKKVKISISKSLSNEQEGNGDESEMPVPKSRQERRRMQQVTGSKVDKPSNPGWIDMVVEGDDVWIVADDGSELPLVESAAAKPAFQRTFIPAMISRVLGVSTVDSTSPAGNSGTQDGAESDGNDNETSNPESSEALKPQQTKNRKGAKSKSN